MWEGEGATEVQLNEEQPEVDADCEAAAALSSSRSSNNSSRVPLQHDVRGADSRKVVKGRKPVASRGQCYINSLPCEILLYIFSFLSVPELCRNVAPVCTAWRDLASDPSLRTRLVFQIAVEGKTIKENLTKSPLLLALEFQHRNDGEDLLLHTALYCPKLKDLTAKFCEGLTVAVIEALVKKCSSLERLDIEGSAFSSDKCLRLIAGFQWLRYLNLSHCQDLDDYGLMTIAGNCRSLEYLDIDGITSIHDISVTYTSENLCNSLTCLILDGEHLTDNSYRSLSLCTRLLILKASFCDEMTDMGLLGIKALKRLRKLKLRKGTQLTSRGLRTLFEDRKMPLHYINFGECALLDNSVLEAMAACCPNLLHLALHWCWEVTDDGVSAIILGCPRLQVLELVGVVRLTGSFLCSIPTALPDLFLLDLEQCNDVDDSLLQAVVERKPSLRVFNYWGDRVLP